MRFRFVGGLDCPDWLLATIAVLSKLTSVKLRLLCTAVIRNAINDADWQPEELEKFAKEPVFVESPEKYRACLAALDFIVVSAARNRCSADNLSEELQQLGLPPEHAQQLHKCYAAHEAMLIEKLNARLPKAPAITAVTEDPTSVKHPECKILQFSLDDVKSSRVSIAVTDAQLKSMKSELGEALSIAQRYQKTTE